MYVHVLFLMHSVDSVGQVEYTRERLGLPKIAVGIPTLAHLGSPMLNEYLKKRLHNPFMVMTRLPKKPSVAPTGVSARAKLDFRYWYDEMIDHKPLNAGELMLICQLLAPSGHNIIII